MDRRRMCPNCRAFITSSDRVCPYCGEKVPARAVDARAAGERLMGFIPAARFTTVMILLIDVALFAGSATRGGGALLEAGAERGPEIFVWHQWYRLVTAGFLHLNWIHLFMNSWVLFDLGAQVEEAFGPARMFVLFFVANCCGFWLSARLSPLTPSVGASAGLFGLIGAMIALGFRVEGSMARALRGLYVRWAIYGLLFGLLPGINNTAHIGGLVSGFTAAYLAGAPGRLRSPKEWFWRAMAGICGLITAWCFYQLYRQITAGSAVALNA